MPVLLWFVGAIASAFVGLLLTILFQDQLSIALVKVLRGFWPGRGRRSLSGTWVSYYTIFPERRTSPTARQKPDAILLIRLRQVGEKVAGAGIGKSQNYSAWATSKDRILTGTWQNSIDGRDHWGAVQLTYSTNGRWLAGKFVGKDSDNHLNHGIWLWIRADPQSPDIKDFKDIKEELHNIAAWANDSGYISNPGKFIAQLDAALDRYGEAEILASLQRKKLQKYGV